MVYVDNEAARYGLIKGTSPTLHSAWLINEYWTAESWNESNTWVARVPSASNCADGPSRGRFAILANTKLKVKRIQLPEWYEKGLVQQWIDMTQESAAAPLTRVQKHGCSHKENENTGLRYVKLQKASSDA